jgi:hypothetical protein
MSEFKNFFRRLPLWVIVLLLALIFGRFIIIAFVQFFHG